MMEMARHERALRLAEGELKGESNGAEGGIRKGLSAGYRLVPFRRFPSEKADAAIRAVTSLYETAVATG